MTCATPGFARVGALDHAQDHDEQNDSDENPDPYRYVHDSSFLGSRLECRLIPNDVSITHGFLQRPDREGQGLFCLNGVNLDVLFPPAGRESASPCWKGVHVGGPYRFLQHMPA